MPNLPENVRTNTQIEPESKAEIAKRNKKGKREPTSLHVDPVLWQEVRVMAVLKNVSLADYFEDALRRKIDADNLEAGRQGYKIGQGGMYIPPRPSSTQEPQPQVQMPQLDEIRTIISDLQQTLKQVPVQVSDKKIEIVDLAAIKSAIESVKNVVEK